MIQKQLNPHDIARLFAEDVKRYSDIVGSLDDLSATNVYDAINGYEKTDSFKESIKIIEKVNEFGTEYARDRYLLRAIDIHEKLLELGEEYAFKHIKEIINEYITDVLHVSKAYPTSPYDIEYIENGVKKYLEVKATSGTKEIFNMSSGEIKFMTQYKENYTLVLITDIKFHFPKTKKYTYSQIMKMRKEYPSTRFYA